MIKRTYIEAKKVELALSKITKGVKELYSYPWREGRNIGFNFSYLPDNPKKKYKCAYVTEHKSSDDLVVIIAEFHSLGGVISDKEWDNAKYFKEGSYEQAARYIKKMLKLK